VLAAVARHARLSAGLTNKTLRPDVATFLNVPLTSHTSAHMSYELRRLRFKGLVTRGAGSHTYRLTLLGAKVAVFFTKLYTRCLRPGCPGAPATPRATVTGPYRRGRGHPRARRRDARRASARLNSVLPVTDLQPKRESRVGSCASAGAAPRCVAYGGTASE
jgi:hypothetical protein